MSEFSGAADIYLENDVFTASPQRLRLMLINAALRHCQQVVDCRKAGDSTQANTSLAKAQAIVSELQTCVRTEGSELAEQVAAMYVIMYCHLLEAQLEDGTEKVESVIRALREEQITWQQLCERGREQDSDERDLATFSAESSASSERSASEGISTALDFHSSQPPAGTPHFQTNLGGGTEELSLDGLSLEA